MSALKNLTSTLYGWIIAFLLPGLAVFYGLIPWSDYVRMIFDSFLGGTSNFGLLVLTLLVALLIGKQISAFTSALYEGWLCRRFRIDPLDVVELESGDLKEPCQKIFNEDYRYHQCLGGLSVALPFLFASSLWQNWSWMSSIEVYAFAQVFLLCEVVTVRVAVSVYRNCSSSLVRLIQLEAREDKEHRPVVTRLSTRAKQISES